MKHHAAGTAPAYGAAHRSMIAQACGKRKGKRGMEYFEWAVRLGGRSCRVEARDKLEASKLAGQKLGVSWRETAREMEFTKGRKIRRRETSKGGARK